MIGTGSTGTQFIVAAAKLADHLTVFQRSPQYCVPSGNGPVDPAEVEQTKQNFDAIWDQVRNSVVAFGFEESGVEAMSVSEEERPPGLPGELGQGQRLPVHVRHVLRHRHEPGGERSGRGVHPLQDRRDRRGPGDRPQAHPDRPLRQAPAVQRGLLRDLQPRQRLARLAQGEPDRGDHPGAACAPRTASSTSSTCWCSPPASTRSTATTGRWTCAGAAAGTSTSTGRDGPTQLPGRHHGRLPEHVHDPRPERAVHQPAAEHRDPGRVDRRPDPRSRANGGGVVEATSEAEDGRCTATTWTAIVLPTASRRPAPVSPVPT